MSFTIGKINQIESRISKEMVNQEMPLISCLCVTESRVQLLARAVNCFLAQTYSKKELVIVCQESDLETVAYLHTLPIEKLVVVKIPHGYKPTLGELRNISIDMATGDYICLWDDDDWYHPDRLQLQWNNLRNNFQPATVMMNILMFDHLNNQAYFSHPRLWESTIFCERQLAKSIRYPSLNKSEDLEFINRMLLKSQIYPTISANLYIYTLHGKNTWDRSHFERFFKNSQQLPSDISILIRDILQEKYTILESAALLNAPEFLQHLNYLVYNKLMVQRKEVSDVP